MTRNRIQHLFLFITCLFFSLSIQSQNSTSSPYSIFGIGELNSPGDATTKAMGHTGIALKSNNYINTMNPASLAYMDSTTFLFNLQGQLSFANFETSSSQQSNFDANIDAISFAFKINRNWGMAFSLSPYSKIGYQIDSEKYILGASTTYPVEYYGEGGLSQFSWMNGIQIIKGLSIGLNTSFLWGSTDIIETSFYPSITGETISNKRTYKLNSFKLDYSLQYHLPLGRDQLSIGAYLHTETQLNTEYEHNISNDLDIELFSDSENQSKLFIPASYGTGLAYDRGGKFLIAADYKYSEWSQSQLLIKQGYLQDTHSASLGFQFTPQRNFDRSYVNRIKYRAGLFFNQSYLNLHGQNLNEQGATIGLGLPLQKSYLNIAYEYSQSGTKDKSLIQEKYNKITIGITFNETWFRKSLFR